MCGIIGIIPKNVENLGEEAEKKELSIAQKMLKPLIHRGPDEQNIVAFGTAILGHSRLSIIDLQTGSQPILNEDNSIAAILNGEIYNYRDLRSSLLQKGHIFRTQSDTEVIVHLYEEYGADFLELLDGMFSFILHDKKKNITLAARDRMGEKPLLYWESKDKIIIASELKAILQYPDIEKLLNTEALALYFNIMYVPAPYCVVKDVKKLPPSHFVTIKDNEVSITKYWNPKLQINWNLSEQEITHNLTTLLKKAVISRKIADVPLGVFLSGGIDSSAVTAFLASNCNEQIKTFSVGFADEIDERPFALEVAQRYGTDHTELYVKDNVEDVLLDVLHYFDEPFGDSSAIPTYLVSREARKHVKVVLTGDGGDELFAGYGSYLDQRCLLGGRITTKLFKKANNILLKNFNNRLLDGLYLRTGNKRANSHWQGVRTIASEDEISNLIIGSTGSPTRFMNSSVWLKLQDIDPLSRAFEYDLNYYLPDDLLKKVDMASMLASLECRAPFLDHHLIEFAMSIPPQLKVKNGELKYILKQSLIPYLPESILKREKTGFGAPVSSWMKGQLEEMVRDLLQKGCCSENYVVRSGIDNIIRNFYSHNDPNFRVAFNLWVLFVFEIWLREYLY